MTGHRRKVRGTGRRKPSAVPNTCPSPTTTSAPHSPGDFSTPSDTGSAATTSMAPAWSHIDRAVGMSSRQPEIVRVADQQHPGAILAVQVGVRPDGDTVNQLDRTEAVAGSRRAGGEHLTPVRVDPLGDPDGIPTGGGHPQVDRLHRGAGSVVERGVGHRQTEQSGDHGLELEHRLQDPLGNFGLVGRIGSHELGPTGQRLGHRRDLVVVGPSAGEAQEAVTPGRVAVGVVIQVGEDVGLTGSIGQLQAPLELERRRDLSEELIDGGQAQEAEHAGDLVFGMRDVGAHGLGRSSGTRSRWWLVDGPSG